MSERITIRPATRGDASDIALLINIATHGGVAHGWAAAEEAEGTYDPIEVGRQEVLSDDADFSWRRATVAAVGDEVVGMLLGYREPDEGFTPPADIEAFMVPILTLEGLAGGTWFISMLGVHKPWRGMSVGSQLLDVAETKARETAAHGLSLIVEDKNAGARALYERRGFAVRDRRPMAPFPDGTTPGKDWLLMVKD